MTTLEQMIAAAERAAEAAQSIRKNAEQVYKDATAVARSLRETGSIPVNQTGWFIHKQEVQAVNSQDTVFNECWTELREAAITESRRKRGLSQ